MISNKRNNNKKEPEQSLDAIGNNMIDLWQGPGFVL
jgi:hypothetical protein